MFAICWLPIVEKYTSAASTAAARSPLAACALPQSMLLQCRTLWEPTTKHISCRVNGSSFSVSAVMGGFSPMTTCFAATGSEESRRQYM
ncbi:hypothetical protein KCU99_g141, partial [Aureobasidium melanogenum]